MNIKLKIITISLLILIIYFIINNNDPEKGDEDYF